MYLPLLISARLDSRLLDGFRDILCRLRATGCRCHYAGSVNGHNVVLL